MVVLKMFYPCLRPILFCFVRGCTVKLKLFTNKLGDLTLFKGGPLYFRLVIFFSQIYQVFRLGGIVKLQLLANKLGDRLSLRAVVKMFNPCLRILIICFIR